MTDDTRDDDVVEVTRTAVVETAEPAIDWDAAPAGRAPAAEVRPVAAAAPPARRGFTNRQRLILVILIWLNILMFIVGYLAVTGRIAL